MPARQRHTASISSNHPPSREWDGIPRGAIPVPRLSRFFFLLLGFDSCRSVRQGKHRQRTTQFGVLGQFLVAADGTQAILVLLEACGHADAGPAADARE